MKITTRIISGYGLFIAVLVGLAAYQVLAVNRMQAINRNLTDVSFRNAFVSLQALQDRDLIQEFAEKSLRLADEDYTRQLEEFTGAFDAKLGQLERGAASGAEREEVGRLRETWDAFTANLGRVQQSLPARGLEALPASVESDLELLRIQTDSVYDAVIRSMSSELERSARTSRTAQIVLASITVAALSITLLVSLLIVRSISKPLAHLTEGTRAITEGKYFYRLDTSRDDEFAQLARDFNTMIRRLSELDELKKDFISHVSHELKSPLASMRETVQLLMDQIPGPLSDKQKRLLELNLQSGDRLTAMIRNLLDLTKIEAGTMEYELKNRDLVPLVQAAVAGFEVRAGENQVRIEASLPESPLYIRCDSDRIVQVVVNLVGNAVKFSPSGAVVRVVLRQIREIPPTMPKAWRPRVAAPDAAGYFALLAVEDSGPGIPAADKEAIFEKFHQVQKGRKVQGQGVGLGLAICRTIVRVHRGALWVEDNPGGGSRFFLLLSPGSDRDAALRASQPI